MPRPAPADRPADPLARLRAGVAEAADELRGAEGGPRPGLERPPRPELGDYSTNAALLLAGALEAQPREIARRLAERVCERLGAAVAEIEVAGPGFLNLRLTDGWYRGALADVLAAGERFGAGRPASPERVLIEFVSANPTGPLTAAGGRHAAYGDALARLLELAGHAVTREYYVNDAGTQVTLLGESMRARARGEPLPEGGYEGDYVAELAAAIDGAGEPEGDVGALAQAGVAALLERVRATLQRFRVTFDSFFSERALHGGDPSEIEREAEALRAAGELYESEGATWLRTSAHGDDKDRVLRRSSGEHTYFAADIAYHADKLRRGYDRVIDVWGADHHGYAPRLRAAWEALGGEPDMLELVIMQLVHVVERGERAAMSKRAGEFVTLDELIDDIGVDAARFLLLQRSHDTTVDLDLDLAREQSAENPVYYVQYAHARIASLRRRAGEERVEAALEQAGASQADGEPALDPAERALVLKLLDWPGVAAEAAERRAPHRVAAYALELAQAFTIFYRDCRVLGAEPPEREAWRIALSVAAQRTIAGSLGLLGVDAPDSM